MNWNGKNKAVTFSYDDGVEQDRKLVEIFNRYGIKCTFNLNTGIQSPESHWNDNGTEINRMNPDGLIELYKGHEIASHGLTHAAPTGLDDAAFEKEMLTDINNIEKIYGTRPVGMAYAYGAYDDLTVERLKKLGIKYGRTVEATHDFEPQSDLLRFRATCHHSDSELFNLAERFLALKSDKPAIFYVWGHSYEFEVNKSWDRIEKLCALLARKDDIFYGTNKEVLL